MDINSELEKIKPDGVVAEVVPIDGSHLLFDVEDHYVRSAVPRRRNEFAAGRAAARAALDTLGMPSVPILRAGDRRPVWPEGIVGSISHAAGFAVALVGQGKDIAGVGIDIEEAAPLKVELLDHILTPREIRARDAKPMVAKSPRCKVSFVAKEALFKSVYPITRVFFGFQDARIEFREGQRWEAVFTNPAKGLPSQFMISHGKWAAFDNMIIATVCVQHMNQPSQSQLT